MHKINANYMKMQVLANWLFGGNHVAIKSTSSCAIIKQKLKKQSTSYYTIYELYITNKMNIIIPSWDNSFKSK